MSEKIMEDMTRSDKTRSDKTRSDKTMADKTMSDKTMSEQRMADLMITRIYSRTMKRARRLFSYEFTSDDNQTLLGLVGPGVPVRAVSLADFLYEGDWNREMRRLIGELPEKSPVYAEGCMLKNMDYYGFRISLYNFLIHAMLILVKDQGREEYALLGDRIWIYDPNRNPVWNNQVWEGFFITKDRDRQYMPPVFESIDPEGLSRTGMSMDAPGISMRKVWEELNTPGQYRIIPSSGTVNWG